METVQKQSLPPSSQGRADRIIETDIPARLDSLRWSAFHTRVVTALGITWILDGLEVTLAGALSGALKDSPTLRFSNLDIGFASSAYLIGAVLGAVGFGWLTDRIGRKKLFFVTLTLYLLATAATALSWNVGSFALFRFLTGAGIGGEYTAINSTIQELVPARYRGWTDLVINGSFWIGAALGAVSAIVLLDPQVIDPDLGWRLAFLTGAALGLIVVVMRLWIPESPRWLMIHGRPEQALRIVSDIERMAVRDRPAAERPASPARAFPISRTARRYARGWIPLPVFLSSSLPARRQRLGESPHRRSAVLLGQRDSLVPANRLGCSFDQLGHEL